ncbi:MAG: hypothetical protein ACE5E7_11475 [Anaerolineae bacterium]
MGETSNQKQTTKYKKHAPLFSRARGQGLVEYVLILALIALGAAATLTVVGTDIGDVFSRITAVQGSESSVSSANAPDIPDAPNIPEDQMWVYVVDHEGNGIAGARIYALNERGWYLGFWGNTNEEGILIFDDWTEGSYKFVSDYRGHRYESGIITWPEQRRAIIQTGARPFTVQVVDLKGKGINNARVYAFNGKKQYVGAYGNTEANGNLTLSLPDGDYFFRADYRAHQYWSDAAATTPDVNTAVVHTGERPFTVKVVDLNGQGLSNVRVYAFNGEKQYSGAYGNTDASGNLTLPLPDGDYFFRADYRAHQYWSNAAVITPDANTAVVNTGERTFTVRVLDADGKGIPDVRVYAFNGEKQYSGAYGNTDANGNLNLLLPDGDYFFRADFRAHQYWSDAAVTTPDVNTAVVNTGEELFKIRVVNADGKGLAGVRVYAFDVEKHYTGAYGNTGEDGILKLDLPRGAFLFRADYRAHQYWSDTADTTSDEEARIQTGERPFTVRVVNANGKGLEDVRVYAFDAEKNYTGAYGNTGEDGILELDLPQGTYLFRADYRAHQYWSDAADTASDEEARIQTGDSPFKVHVVNADGKGLEGVRVYAFDAEKHYTGAYGNTGEDGILELDLPQGTYLFRADYRAHQYWSDAADTASDEEARIQTGEQKFTVRVVNAEGKGLESVRVYAFDAEKHYTGAYGNTDKHGKLEIDLPQGTFLFRADYRAHQYWSDMADTTSDEEARIQTGERKFTVRVVDADGEGIRDVRVYAFDTKGNYTGAYGNTDKHGKLEINLPQGTFRFRADFRAHQYWSDDYDTSSDSEARIQTGEQPFTLSVVDKDEEGVKDVRVYAFDTEGHYTGAYGNTDKHGNLTISLPEGTFTFRADYKGKQVWSDAVSLPGADPVTIQLDD